MVRLPWPTITATGTEPVAEAEGTRPVSFPGFEGLRGVLALAVVVYHAGIWAGFTWGVQRTDHGYGAFVRHFDLAVGVFFVLSAFLLHRPFVIHDLRAGPRPSRGPFALRRLARLFPAYWLALTVALLLDGAFAEASIWDLTRLYLLIQVYWPETAHAGIAQAWSLNTELVFYLLLPLWASLLSWVVGGRGGAFDGRAWGARETLALHNWACAALLLCGLAIRVGSVGRVENHVLFWFPLNLDLFALGMWLATASAAAAARGGSPHDPPRPLRLLAEVPATALALVVLAFTVLVAFDLPIATNETGAQEALKRVLTHLIAVALIVPLAFRPGREPGGGRGGPGAYRRFLTSAPVAWCGTVSYGVYLWHITVQSELVARFAPADHPGPYWYEGGWLLVLGGAAGSMVVASVSWLVVESPLLRRVRSGPGRAGGDR